MRKNYAAATARLLTGLVKYEASHGPLRGIADPDARDAFAGQIIDSEQRVRYFQLLQLRSLDPTSADPTYPSFDPLRAAILNRNAGDYDEALWMVFLFVHFGKHRRAGWRYARDVYGKLGQGGRWSWRETAADPLSFRYWLDQNQDALKAEPGPRGFGNHRKHERLDAWSDNGTGAAVQSYVEWVLAAGGDHAERFSEIAGMTPQDGFDHLYESLADVRRFGRVAKFDYLMTIRKLALLDIAPPHSYVVGSTGPLQGGRLLFHADIGQGNAREIQAKLSELGKEIGISADVLEDAVCNWQKSPTAYARFSG